VRAARKAVGAGLALAAAYAAPAAFRLPPAGVLFRPLTRVEGNRVALTFDDGPAHSTERFLEVLQERGVRATFFVVGEQVEANPGILEEIASCGHEIGLHCHRHRNHLRLGPKATLEDLRRGAGIIEEVLGRRVALYRPPYGVFNAASWSWCGRRGYRRVLWSRWGKDWEEGATPSSVLRNLGSPEAGEIVLLHDADRYSAPGSWRNTLAALPELLEQLSERGIGAGPVGRSS